ncbi:MAG TPA: hypothetical protein VF618_25455 [Thermoanaerobaculia bacterium]
MKAAVVEPVLPLGVQPATVSPVVQPAVAAPLSSVAPTPVPYEQPSIATPIPAPLVSVTAERPAPLPVERPVARRARSRTAAAHTTRQADLAIIAPQAAPRPSATVAKHPRALRPVEGEPEAQVMSYEVIRVSRPIIWLLIIALTIAIPVASSVTHRRPALAR